MPPLKLPFGPPPDLTERHPEWLQRLAGVVNRRNSEPYIYGVFDCAVFAREAILAVTGVTVLPGFDPPQGWIACAKFMIKHDLADMEEVAIAALGVAGAAEDSQPGDIISWKGAGEWHLAVRVGDTALSPTGMGLQPIERPTWNLCWAIGRKWPETTARAGPTLRAPSGAIGLGSDGECPETRNS